MQIRAATDPSDLDEVVRLRVEFIADVRGVAPSSFDPGFVAATRSFVEDRHADGRLRAWLAEEDGGAVGLVSVLVTDAPPLPEDPRRHEGYVINLYVVPSARRRGLARALMTTVFDATAALDLRRLFLHATDEGRPLYDALEFRPDARWLALRFDADGRPTTAPLVEPAPR